MITKIDPPDYGNASTVQIDSDSGNHWLATTEIEEWAAAHGFVRTSEYHLRQVLVDGRRRFRGVCYRITDEERRAAEDAQRQMIARGDALRDALQGQSGGKE